MQEILIRIAERASTLDERLEGIVVSDCAETTEEQKRSRFSHWKQNATNGNDSFFRKRLSLDGLTLGDAERIVCSARLQERKKLPAWTQTLAGLIDSTKFIDLSKYEQRVPFDELLLSFVHFASRSLRTLSSTAFDFLTGTAQRTLELTLLRKLSFICSRPLVLELNAARLLGKLRGETPQDRYYHFLKNQIATPQGMLDFFLEYSAAGRLVAILVDQWIDSNTEFLFRLQRDLPEIKTYFNGGQDPGAVVEIFDHLSDAHNRGRTTKQVTFASGLKLIYKPKNLTMDSAFQNLLKWINDQEKLLPLKSFHILNRKTHGWVEFLSAQPCRNLAEVDRYFIRAGMLLCLFHVLGASDCHHENLFACGEDPVMIDLETLLELQPAPPSGYQGNADQIAQEICKMSLLYTGMLPRLVFGDAGTKGVDFSALAAEKAQIPFGIPGWTKTETDEMQLEMSYQILNVATNRPMMNDTEVSPVLYREKLEEGFCAMYRFLVECKGELMTNGVLESLCVGEVRYLNRSTAEYFLILQKSLDPAFLKEGIDRSLYLEVLFRQLMFRNQESIWSLVKSERRAMERFDIPYFVAGPRDAFLMSDGDPISNFVVIPAADRLVDRMARLSENEMNRQVLFLRTSWSMQAGSNTIHRSDGNLDVPLLSKQDLIQTAINIAEKLKECAIRSRDGSITWIGAEFVPRLNQFSIVPCGNTLYSGKPGIALFLAALDRFVPDQGYAELAIGVLQTLRETLRGEKAEFYIRLLGIGAMSGISSTCWCLLRIGEVLQKQEFIEDARRFGKLITQHLIASDRSHDVIGGSAGAILCLLALHRCLPDSVFLALAEQCAEHLLKESVEIAPGIRAWQSGQEMLTGFAHGTSGYAYALLRLFETTKKEEYRDAALQAFAYERSLFSPEHENWPDLRKDLPGGPGPKFMVGWCHGAPGIALARVAYIEQINHPEIRDDIQAGLNTTLRAPIESQDDLCCGNFSRIETLLVASRYLNRPDLRDAALLRASMVAQFASEEGAFCLHPGVRDGLVNPGFMKGIAGIGYSLLRLADPDDSLPSPLLM